MGVRTYDALGNCLTDGVDLRGVTTTTDADADVDIGCTHTVSRCSRCPLLCAWCLLVHPAQPLFQMLLLPPSTSFAPDFSLLLPPPTQISRTELVETEDEERLVDLEAEDLRLNERKRLAVDLDQTLALLGVGDSGGGLLLAEALDALNGRHDGGVVGVRVFWSVG